MSHVSMVLKELRDRGLVECKTLGRVKGRAPFA